MYYGAGKGVIMSIAVHGDEVGIDSWMLNTHRLMLVILCSLKCSLHKSVASGSIIVLSFIRSVKP